MHRGNGPKAFSAVGETEFANGIAAMSASLNYGPTRVCAGIVSYCDLRLGAIVEEVLNAHVQAGGGRFRGVRQIVAWDADQILVSPESGASAGMLEDTRFRDGFSRLAPLGLSFESWLYHPQIKDLAPLARAFPETRIVLNHAGGPVGIGPYAGKRDEVFADWSASIIELATCPNVFLKFGGLGMRVNGFGFDKQAKPPSSEHVASVLSPFFDVCVSAFGSDRCMFESNFPVDKGSYSYGVCWNAFKRMAAGASIDEKANLFSGTAARFYKLDVSSESSVP
jgi:L-fuconolactonase